MPNAPVVPKPLFCLQQAIQKVQFGLRYEPTFLPKTGFDALLAKIPVIKKAGAQGDTLAMDLDVICGLYGGAGNLIESVWYGNLRGASHAVRHHGDRFVGMNKSYVPNRVEQSLSVRLLELPQMVHRLVFFVHSYHHQALKWATFGECVLMGDDGMALCEFALNDVDDGVFGLAVWQMVRTDNAWQTEMLTMPIHAKTAEFVAQHWAKSTLDKS